MRTCGASRVSECAGAPPSPGSCKTRASGSYPRRAVLRFHYQRPTPAPAAIPAATFPLSGPSAVPAASPRARPTYRRAVVYGFYSGLQLNIRQTGARFCCMKAYSLDLRHKILDAYDHKRGSQRRVLQRLGLPRRKRPFMPPNATRRGSSRPVPPTSNARPRSISGTCSLSMRPASISRCLACMAEPLGRSGASGPRR